MVCVVVPIYRPQLSQDDRVSLLQTCTVLAGYPIIAIHPEGLDVSAIQAEFPQLQFRSFQPQYFAGVEGYNRLMLSEDLYAAFLDYEYMLICQLDVFIFKDDLADWCRRGYDYVGAPWLKRGVYDWPGVRQFVQLYSAMQRRSGRLTQFDRYNRVGNGGLSLRRVESHLKVIRNQQDEVRLYAQVNNRKHLFNEDTFWAMVPQGFKYPTAEEAVLFSYNKYPEISYRLSGGAMPFGCHGWTKPKYKPFWCKDGGKPTFPQKL